MAQGASFSCNEQLSLRAVELRSTDIWTNAVQGLCFLFPTAGTGVGSKCGVHQPLTLGEATLWNSAPVVEIQPSAGTELAFCWFAASLEDLLSLFAPEEIYRLQRALACQDLIRSYAACDPIAKQCHRLLARMSPGRGLVQRTQVLELAATLLSEELSRARRPESQPWDGNDRFESAWESLSIDQLLGSTITELAVHFRCSPRHLNRLFRAHLGCSASELRMRMRLLKARSLLRDPSSKVCNVARQCGFNDLSHFNRCFGRRFGRSPGRWRHSNQEAEGMRLGPESGHPDQGGGFSQ